MAVKLSPVYLDAQFINGVPAVGAQLFTYAAGSTTKQATYTDSTGAVANSNPIILNARGEPPAIWLNAGQTYKFVFASPTDTDPPTAPIRVLDNISGVNDNTINIDEWVASNFSPTYLNATQFTIQGDQTSTFQVNRRVKVLVSAGTLYGYISASAYTTLTTITVQLDSGALDTGLSQVSLALLSASNPSVPALPDNIFRVVKSTLLSVFAKFDLSALTVSRTVALPDKDGTLAMVSDLPSVPALETSASDPTYASTSSTKSASPQWVKGAFNVTGNAPLFACRAWVNFNGTLAGPIAPRASGNVSSITDNGTGDYTINFITAMPDANYAMVNGNNEGDGLSLHGFFSTTAPTTTAARVVSRNQVSNSFQDSPWISLAFFR